MYFTNTATDEAASVRGQYNDGFPEWLAEVSRGQIRVR